MAMQLSERRSSNVIALVDADGLALERGARGRDGLLVLAGPRQVGDRAARSLFNGSSLR